MFCFVAPPFHAVEPWLLGIWDCRSIVTTDGIEETVYNPHLKERTVITISLKLQQVEFLMRIKCNRPQLLLSSCTYWRPDSTCSCAGRSSPRCAGTRILIATRVSVILNLILVNVSQSNKTYRLCHQGRRAYCWGRPLQLCFVGCSLELRGSTDELLCRTWS